MVAADTEQRSEGKVMWNKTNDSMSIHTFLSITMSFFRLLNNRNCKMCLCGGVRSDAELPVTPQLPHGFKTAASPYHFPITGQLGDLLALACGTPSRGWSQSQDW